MERFEVGEQTLFFSGYATGDQLVLESAQSPARVFAGSAATGFTERFSVDVAEQVSTAWYAEQWYVGVVAGEAATAYLYTVTAGGVLQPVVTGCAQEPGVVQQLQVCGDTLWVFAAAGVFYLRGGVWQHVAHATLVAGSA